MVTWLMMDMGFLWRDRWAPKGAKDFKVKGLGTPRSPKEMKGGVRFYSKIDGYHEGYDREKMGLEQGERHPPAP